MREIKVWGGTHGNEPLGIALARSLMVSPIKGVSSGIVNLKAVKAGQRFIDINMINGYPGNEKSGIYEERRAPLVLRESQGYDAVLDFHDYNDCEGADNAFVGRKGVSPQVLGFLAELGFKNIIQTSYDSLSEHVPNGFSVDIGLRNGGPRTSVKYWRQALERFAHAHNPPAAQASEFNWYSATSDHSIHTDMVSPAELDGSEGPLVRLPAHIEVQLAVDGPLHWSCWNPRETNGWWAELCTPVAVPDTSNWPTDAR